MRFLQADYTVPLVGEDEAFDLLISLHAGLVWAHCQRYLRRAEYRLDDAGLDGYLVPKQPKAANADLIRRSGRGIAYSRSGVRLPVPTDLS